MESNMNPANSAILSNLDAVMLLLENGHDAIFQQYRKAVDGLKAARDGNSLRIKFAKRNIEQVAILTLAQASRLERAEMELNAIAESLEIE